MPCRGPSSSGYGRLGPDFVELIEYVRKDPRIVVYTGNLNTPYFVRDRPLPDTLQGNPAAYPPGGAGEASRRGKFERAKPPQWHTAMFP
jgi:hypothetical protein